LLADGHRVVAIDNFDGYYSPRRKRRNVASLVQHPEFKLVECDYGDRLAVTDVLKAETFDVVLHLAGQSGVRSSVDDSLPYERANVGNLIPFLEAVREFGPKKLVVASSSSVYGKTTPLPFKEDAPCLDAHSPYGASKRAAEIFLATYCTLHGFKLNIIRPFTVYGPRQRPDMALGTFMRLTLTGEPLMFFGDGRATRDYVYVTDVVNGLIAALTTFNSDYSIYNLGSGTKISLSEVLEQVEVITGKKAVVDKFPSQRGDLEHVCADISKAQQELNYAPKVSWREGLEKTMSWVENDLRIEAATSPPKKK
jgi:UDP-glucuronate 4-epimerase